MRAAVHALRLHMPAALTLPDFCKVLAAKNPTAFWELVDGLALLVVVEVVGFGEHSTPSARKTNDSQS